VRLNWSDPSGLKVVKTYTFRRGSFLVELNQRVENNSADEWQGGQYRQFQRTPPQSCQQLFWRRRGDLHRRGDFHARTALREDFLRSRLPKKS
jgi:YidC/Oxa1 family membrane protein insertase